MLHSSAETQFALTNQSHRHESASASSPGTPHLHDSPKRDLNNHQTAWLSGRVPNGYWDIRENRVRYLQWLAGRYGFQAPRDWYGVRKLHFQKNGGGGLLRNVYGSSVLKAVVDLMPNYEWKEWMFGGTPTGFWKAPANRCRYMDWLAVQLKFQVADDWYNVTGTDFFAHHGGGLLNNEFKGSVQAVLLDYKPNYGWKPWRFTSVPQGYWNNVDNRRVYLRWLGQQLGFETRADWVRLRRQHFYDHNGSGVFVGYYHGSTERAILELFSTAEDSQPV